MAFCVRYVALIFCGLAAVPATACELDGFLHGRYTPFGTAGSMHSAYYAVQAQPLPSPAETDGTQRSSDTPEAPGIAEMAANRASAEHDTAEPLRPSPLP